MKRRFPVLKERVRIATRRVPTLVKACAILHNIAKYLKEDETPEGDSDHEQNNEPTPEPVPETANAVNRILGQQRRDQIASQLL